MSLDGYIADKKGGVDWLSGDGSDPENLGSYSEFSDTVDTVILGTIPTSKLSPSCHQIFGPMRASNPMC